MLRIGHRRGNIDNIKASEEMPHHLPHLQFVAIGRTVTEEGGIGRWYKVSQLCWVRQHWNSETKGERIGRKSRNEDFLYFKCL